MMGCFSFMGCHQTLFLQPEADGGEEKEGPGETKFQPQIGMPAEEDLNSWSHHHSVDTIDDEIMREV